ESLSLLLRQPRHRPQRDAVEQHAHHREAGDAEELVPATPEGVGELVADVLQWLEPGILARLVGPVEEGDQRAGERPARHQAGGEEAAGAEVVAVAAGRAGLAIGEAL